MHIRTTIVVLIGYEHLLSVLFFPMTKQSAESQYKPYFKNHREEEQLA